MLKLEENEIKEKVLRGNLYSISNFLFKKDYTRYAPLSEIIEHDKQKRAGRKGLDFDKYYYTQFYGILISGLKNVSEVLVINNVNWKLNDLMNHPFRLSIEAKINLSNDVKDKNIVYVITRNFEKTHCFESKNHEDIKSKLEEFLS